ncbi:hypothetical protein [Roseateles toxinivorans]|uniref:Uncharacterized protein n=1 Tax=Roseateles toxinivorans TaxID=270368 RepID=A0A4R6QIB2_9BURK|nr:hypothetical protein [Roseateles toxinivorans]TDP61362.1 hypothetical protein DES47_11345 [Roseateles toxinivorans]
MTQLTLNKAFDSAEPVLRVENRLAAGRHRFSLVVIDAQGRASEADLLVVTVQKVLVPSPGPRIPPATPRRPVPARPDR